MSRRPPNRPARRFAARAALVLLAIGVTVHAFVVRTVDAELQGQLEQRGEFVAEFLLGPALAEGDDADTAAARALEEDPQLIAVTIRDAQARIVGSAGQRVTCDVAQCVPVPGTDGLVAAIEQDDATVRAAATDVTRRLALVVGGGLLALWLAIVPLAYRLGRELRAQADELREKSVELQRLLDQEQLTVQRLREVDEMRDRFLESVSHELRTPLTVVQGSLQMLEAKGDDIPAPLRAQLVTRAYDKAQRLSALVQALLDLNNASAEDQEQRWVDLRRATDAAASALPPRAVEYDLDVEGIVTDRAQLVRSLGALLGNVIRHASGDDPIVVRARRRGDTDVELQVDDRGPGIPPDLREEVFQPFRQPNLQDAHSPGTGIGLALVAAYAARHDGRAWITGRDGGGARVHVLLPGVVADRPPDAVDDFDDAVADAIVTPVVASTRPGATTPATSAREDDAGEDPDDPDGGAGDDHDAGADAVTAASDEPRRTRRVVARRRVVRRVQQAPEDGATADGRRETGGGGGM